MIALAPMTELRSSALVSPDDPSAGMSKRNPARARPSPSTSLKSSSAAPTLPAGNRE
jgi:hypothetical protein